MCNQLASHFITYSLPDFFPASDYSVDTLFVELRIGQCQYEVSILRVLASTDELDHYTYQITIAQ